jgi:hypothetical protein
MPSLSSHYRLESETAPAAQPPLRRSRYLASLRPRGGWLLSATRSTPTGGAGGQGDSYDALSPNFEFSTGPEINHKGHFGSHVEQAKVPASTLFYRPDLTDYTTSCILVYVILPVFAGTFFLSASIVAPNVSGAGGISLTLMNRSLAEGFLSVADALSCTN